MAAKIGTLNSETGRAFLLTSFCNQHIGGSKATSWRVCRQTAWKLTL